MENKPIENRSRSNDVLPSRAAILKEFNIFTKAKTHEQKNIVLSKHMIAKPVVFKRKEFYTPTVSPRNLNKTMQYRNIATPIRLNVSHNLNGALKEIPNILKNNLTQPFSRAPKLEALKTSETQQLPQPKYRLKYQDEILELPSVKTIKLKPTISVGNSRHLSPVSKSIPEIKQIKINIQTVTRCAHITKTGMIAGRVKANNQDAIVIKNNFAQTHNQILLGVLDGHGIHGHLVSNFVKRVLPLEIESALPADRNSNAVTSNANSNLSIDEIHTKIEHALTIGFSAANTDLSQNRGIDANFSGTTVNLVIIRGRFLFCANVGDSRAIIGRYDNNR